MRRRRPRKGNNPAISKSVEFTQHKDAIGIVLSGGGVRAAYQIGALKALSKYLKQPDIQIKVVVGASIGAINGIILGACLSEGIEEAVRVLERTWEKRTFRNTFADPPSLSFIRAIKVAAMQYLNPGPNANPESIFNPRPLMEEVNKIIVDYGGLAPDSRHPSLESIAVMTTIEAEERKPLLFLSRHKELDVQEMLGATFDVSYVDELKAKHGFASAALPSVLPPIELDTKHGRIRLIDGGISQNVPVDPAVRMGAEKVIVIDVSGRDWWLIRDKEALDKRPEWEVPAEAKSFCLRPPETFVIRCQKPLGMLLKNAVAGSTASFIKAVGPVYPIFKLLKQLQGEDVAYECLSYVTLHPDYIHALIESGYNETIHLLNNREKPQFKYNKTYEDMYQEVVEPDLDVIED